MRALAIVLALICHFQGESQNAEASALKFFSWEKCQRNESSAESLGDPKGCASMTIGAACTKAVSHTGGYENRSDILACDSKSAPLFGVRSDQRLGRAARKNGFAGGKLTFLTSGSLTFFGGVREIFPATAQHLHWDRRGDEIDIRGRSREMTAVYNRPLYPDRDTSIISRDDCCADIGNIRDVQGVKVYPSPLLITHFGQLAAQNPPLSEADARSHSRKSGDGDSCMRGKTARAILAGFLLLLGVAFMKGAFEATNQPNPLWGFKCAGYIGWIVGFGIIGYGTLLVLSVIGPISPLD